MAVHPLRRELEVILLGHETIESDRRAFVPVGPLDVTDLILRALDGARPMTLAAIALRVMHSEDDVARGLATLRGVNRVVMVNPGAVSRSSSVWRSIKPSRGHE
jgi:hypothetical protein